MSARREARLEPGRVGGVQGATDGGRAPHRRRSHVAGSQLDPQRRLRRGRVAIPGIRLLYDAPATVGRKLDRVAALGAGWLRFDAAWPEIEIERGRYDYSRVDRVLDGAHAPGLRVGSISRFLKNPGRYGAIAHQGRSGDRACAVCIPLAARRDPVLVSTRLSDFPFAAGANRCGGLATYPPTTTRSEHSGAMGADTRRSWSCDGYEECIELKSPTTSPRSRGTYLGERMAGCLRSKNSVSPTLSLSISSMIARNSGGISLRSPSRASASVVKYMTMV